MAPNLKTWSRPTLHGVSPKHLPRYLAEFSYRFGRRSREKELPGSLPCHWITAILSSTPSS